MRRAWLVLLAALVLLGGVGAAVVLVPTRTVSDHRPATASPAPEPSRTPLLVPAGPGTPVGTAALAAALAQRVRDPALGGRLLLSVVDVASGQVLLDDGGTRPGVPASTAKLATAVAALQVLGPDRRFTTRLLQGRPGQVVLVGGGDPTLAGKVPVPWVPGARLAALARGVHAGQVVVDDSLFNGPRLGPGWKGTYTSEGSVAPVSALEVDEGRSERALGSPRVADPALAAGEQLARLVGARSVVRGTAPVGAVELAHVDSPPVSVLVEGMLTVSDNDLAEALARQVALATGQPATFAGEAAGLVGVLGPGAVMRDASGLSPLDRIPPLSLARLLAKAATEPTLAPILTGLPVAGFDGTLDKRFRNSPAAGEVRAKTGTLDDVDSLAGLVRTRGGRLLAFSAIADQVQLDGTQAAERALDRLVGVIAGCGCP